LVSRSDRRHDHLRMKMDQTKLSRAISHALRIRGDSGSVKGRENQTARRRYRNKAQNL
jgi:hypothetical protein